MAGWQKAWPVLPVLALALVSYTSAVVIDGRFRRRLRRGHRFGSTAGDRRAREISYVEDTAGLASMLAWLAFGALVLPEIGNWFDWRLVFYALLSLTVIRMVPVACRSWGPGRLAPTWRSSAGVGPCGLASIIFALFALEPWTVRRTSWSPSSALTVLFSVVVHGLSARPLAAKASDGAIDDDVGEHTPGDLIGT